MKITKLVYKYVDLHGGFIDVMAPQENGEWITVFDVFLPDFPGGEKAAEEFVAQLVKAFNASTTERRKN